MDALAASGGSTFAATCSVEVVAPTDSAPAPTIDAVIASVVTGSRGRSLRAQLAAMHPAQAREEIDDAIQTACGRFIDVTDGIAAPGQVYAWIRITAHRVLSREDDRLARQVPTDPSSETLDAIEAPARSPAEQVIDREDESDLTTLARSVAAELPLQRQRDVLALYGAGYKRPEIAAHLGIRERTVKRDLLEILDRTRSAIARLAGGGCDAGESLIVRYACGLATPVEESQAQLHLARCQRCTQFHERLHLWRDKVGAILPIPASAHADPGLLERTLHKTLDGLGSLRQHVADGGAHVKQQTATAYYRATDLTPAAGARPGAVAAVVAGCLAAGTGTYTCVEQGINPLTVIPGLGERGAQQEASTPPRDPTTDTAPQPIPLPVAPDSSATPAQPSPPPDPTSAEPKSSEPSPAPASGADSLSGLNGNPTPSPAPAPPPSPTATDSNTGGSSGTTFGGL
jgi:RNA polymerase sigma factor (sigma-70 family)